MRQNDVEDNNDQLWMGLTGGLLGLILFGGVIVLVYGELNQTVIELFKTLGFVGLLFGPLYKVVQKPAPSYLRSLLVASSVLVVAAVLLVAGGHKPESVAITAVLMGTFAFLQGSCAYLLDRHTSRT